MDLFKSCGKRTPLNRRGMGDKKNHSTPKSNKEEMESSFVFNESMQNKFLKLTTTSMGKMNMKKVSKRMTVG